jgi:hypothetical protein
MPNQSTHFGAVRSNAMPMPSRRITTLLNGHIECVIEERDSRAEPMEWLESRAERCRPGETASEYEIRVLAELKQVLAQKPKKIVITAFSPGTEHSEDYVLLARERDEYEAIVAGWSFSEVPKSLDLLSCPVPSDSPYCTEPVPLVFVIADGTCKVTPKGIVDLLGANILGKGLLPLMHEMLHKASLPNMGITARALMRTVFGKGRSHECSAEIDLLNEELFTLIESISTVPCTAKVSEKRMLDALVSELEKRPDLLKIPISDEMTLRLERYAPCLSDFRPMPLAGVFLAGLSCVCKNRWPSLELDDRDVSYLCEGFSREDPVGQVLYRVLTAPSSKIMEDLQKWREQFDDGGMLDSRFAYLRAARGLFGARGETEEPLL